VEGGNRNAKDRLAQNVGDAVQMSALGQMIGLMSNAPLYFANLDYFLLKAIVLSIVFCVYIYFSYNK